MHHLTKKTWTSHRTKLKKMLTLFVRQERRVYYLHRYKARKFPSKYLTSINDGMDQHTTNIPNLRRINKSMAGLKMVGTHLVGSIIHSGQVPDGKAFYGCFLIFFKLLNIMIVLIVFLLYLCCTLTKVKMNR